MSVKMLFILNVADRVNSFSYASMIAALSLNIEYHIAGNWKYASEEERQEDEIKYGIHIHQIDFERIPYHPRNFVAFRQLGEIIKKEKYDVIHCNTPIGGVAGRILGDKYNVKKIIYQAHGFHFYDGAPKQNWLIYYPIEKWLAKKTDAIITINTEDFARSKSLKLRNNGKRYYVPGVGVDTKEFSKIDTIHTTREEIGATDDDFLIVVVGRLEKNKNCLTVIKSLAMVNDPRIKLVFCGDGDMREELEETVISNNLSDRVRFLGNRSDIKDIYQLSDCFVLASFREGLSRSIMEAMASGLPCVVSNIRGNTDLIINDCGGYICNPNKPNEFSNAIKKLFSMREKRESMSLFNKKRVMDYDIEAVIENIKNIYIEELQ